MNYKLFANYFSRCLILLFISLAAISCVSVKEYNKKLAQPISEKELVKDVSYVQKKLEKLHPNLYTYISKEALNNKFDSVRKVLVKPITASDFFLLISPVVASVKQGHMSMSLPTKRISKKEQKRLAKAGLGPLSQFEFEWMNEKLYVIKNKSKQKSIALGAEVLSINNITPQQLHNKYKTTYTSDGLNKTYLKRAFSKRFTSYLTNEIGINDSLNYVFKQNDSLKEIVVNRLKVEIKEKNKSKDKATNAKETTPKNEKQLVETKREKRIFGYDETTKTFSKKLSFVASDSSIAVLKIKDFSKGNFRKAYKSFFEDLKNKNVKTLILDLRNNPGGRVVDAVDLYSYLTAGEFQMLQPAQVVSKTSLWKLGMFDRIPKILYPLAAIGYPFYMGFSTIRTKKNDDGSYTYSLVGSQKRQNKTNYFSGKIYVLINGNSFSAACLVSSALKANKEVIFVGEETGGAFNSTVAGLLPIVQLPNSNLSLRIGLMDIGTTNKTEVFGRGVFPDKEIVPTLNDKIQNKDPEMEWILNDIKLKNK
ncbi:S41 family peptidase [Flavobacterium sp.]|uniref:S41 family peptidase n=1 Tax=Flavobacterium sp. TaxID=239 RepID=UPI0026157D63|nr:S41 family peptidase [Flavobacterium sp.]